MAVTIPRRLVDYVLLGPTAGRRQLQDSPILGDVWVAFAQNPDKEQELLITPHRRQPAGAVAVAIDRQVKREPSKGADIAPLQSVIAARLTFEEVLRVVVPMTNWWHERRVQDQLKILRRPDAGPMRLRAVVKTLVDFARSRQDRPAVGAEEPQLPVLDRLIALSGLILWAGWQKPSTSATVPEMTLESLLDAGSEAAIEQVVTDLFSGIEAAQPSAELVFQVSRNRAATPCVERSVPAVKADAARGLFSVRCAEIAWAVIDSGIHGAHAAFKCADGSSRVRASFDFTDIREIVSLDNGKIFESGDEAAKKARLDKLLLRKNLKRKPRERDAVRLLKRLAEDARDGRATHWDWVRPFVEIKPATRPGSSDHGTHVAGIIGASRAEAPKEAKAEYRDGMCPDIQLYDFRVLASGIKETEFAVIAALQFVRHLNARTDHMVIHGANLSLSIPHDVRNYACGRTPVCVESERLVDSGVVVVAAAGNLGYHRYETESGGYEGYAAFSVTDPGNAEGVITVGSTHRYSPHTYGVSFFSSRGPTGDGRMKPDLVAPGERIRAPVRDGWGDFDGTSMAAPHVSGAAAMLMARYTELIGQPRRIKSVLCESATDLGRERSFQGHGMLDVLRAFQSI